MQTLKSAYTHGLENIYALEFVDPNSIRPFQIEKKAVQTISKQKRLRKYKESPQLELDLGLGFRRWMTPFFLDEPVDNLQLTKSEKKFWIITRYLA